MAMTPNQLRDSLKGVVHLVMTPMAANGDVDYGALKQMLQDQVSRFKGRDVVFLAGGSTAEFFMMNDDEFKKYVDVVAEAVNGEVPLVMGTSRPGTRYTIELSQYAERAGVDGVMIVNVYYHPTNEECIYQHYRKIAESIDIGVVVYNNPVTTKLYIYPELMKRISKVPNIVGNKDNTNNPMLFYRMIKTVDPSDMNVFTGLGEVMFQYVIPHGCKAFVADSGNYVPDITFAVADAAKQGDIRKVYELVEVMDPLQQFIGRISGAQGAVPDIFSKYIPTEGVSVYQSVIKEAMALTGTPCGKVRDPMYNLKDDEIAELKTILTGMGAL